MRDSLRLVRSLAVPPVPGARRGAQEHVDARVDHDVGARRLRRAADSGEKARLLFRVAQHASGRVVGVFEVATDRAHRQQPLDQLRRREAVAASRSTVSGMLGACCATSVPRAPHPRRLPHVRIERRDGASAPVC